MIRNRPISFTCIVVASFLLSTGVYAQESVNLQTTDVTTIRILPPGIGYEKSIGERSTLYGSAFAAIAFAYTYSDYFGSDVYFDMYPGLSFAYRYYYNFYRRNERGKKTSMNSANYLSPVITTIFSRNPVEDGAEMEDHMRPITTVGGVWGMQRNYRRWFHLNLELGLGYYFAKGTTTDGSGNRVTINHEEPTLLFHISLGAYLRKKKDK